MKLFFHKNIEFLKNELHKKLENIDIINADISCFPCGEINIKLLDNVENEEIIIFYSLNNFINEKNIITAHLHVELCTVESR